MSVPYTAEQKLAAISRELRFRRQVYPRRIADKKMTPELAKHQIAIFEAIEADYQKQAAGERLL